MEKAKCACGKTMSKYFYNSTIRRKQCPNCDLKNKLSGDAKAVKEGLKKKRTVKKKTPRQLAMDNADNWFSRYIRIKYAFKIQDGDVFCRCIINPSIIKHAKFMDNGHCFSRKDKATRYEEDNCRPQNRSSNRFSGEADHYTFIDNLKEEIGEERFNRIDHLRKQEGEDTEMFYKQKSDKYRYLVNRLVNKHNIKKWW